MLNNITWQGYWVTLALLSAGYYLAIYVLYFRNDFKIAFPKRNTLQKYSAASPAVAAVIEQQVQTPADQKEEGSVMDINEGLVGACLDELNAYFDEAKRARLLKEEVLYALQTILRKYPSLTKSDYKEAVTNVIVSEAAHHCALHFSSEEMVQVWLEK